MNEGQPKFQYEPTISGGASIDDSESINGENNKHENNEGLGFKTEEKKQQILLNLETEIVNFNDRTKDIPNVKELHLKLDGNSIGELVFRQNPNERTLRIS